MSFLDVNNDEMTIPFLTVALSTLGRDLIKIDNLLGDLSLQSCKEFEVLMILQNRNKNVFVGLRDLLVSYGFKKNGKILVDNGMGLARSRNIAMRNSKGKYMLLCDDDCRYPADAICLVKKAVKSYDETFYTFVSIDSEGEIRKKAHKSKPISRHDVKTIMSVGSIEIVVDREILIKNNNCWFDERFGLGKKFNTGAENIFMKDLLDRGYKGSFFPYKIVVHQKEVSCSGTIIDIKQLAFARGGMFKRMFGSCFGFFVANYYFVREVFFRKKVPYKIRHYFLLLKGFAEAPSS